jgi:pyridoxal phosphate enzyme (YggS family)
MDGFGYIDRNLDRLYTTVRSASVRAGVPEPQLVAVTKSASHAEVLHLASLGVGAIGENRPANLVLRGDLLAAAGYFPDLHQIGTLQSNKARLVVGRAALIHSLSSLSLAKELSKRARAEGVRIPVLVEINSASEPQKDGVMPGDAERFLYSLSEYPELCVRGLMTMGPAGCTSDEIRGYFRKTRVLFDTLGTQYGFSESGILSMGMTDSYEVAIEEGSTMIRVGRRLFEK